MFISTGHVFRILDEEFANLLDVTLGEPLPFAIALSSLQGVIPVVERNDFGDTRLIIHIKDIVILASREKVITRIVPLLSFHTLGPTLGDHISYLYPLPTLPHESLRVHAVSEYTYLPFLLSFHSLYIALILLICTVVISLPISASLMPDRLEADSPTCLLNIYSTSWSANRAASAVKVLKKPSDPATKISPLGSRARLQIEQGSAMSWELTD